MIHRYMIALVILLTQCYIICIIPQYVNRNVTIEYQVPIYSFKVTVTAYTARECETDEDPEHTATMEQPIAGRTCAVSRDLMHWLGGRVYIEGIGVRRVNDLMNERFSKRIDVFYGTVKEAKTLGKQTRTVSFLGR